MILFIKFEYLNDAFITDKLRQGLWHFLGTHYTFCTCKNLRKRYAISSIILARAWSNAVYNYLLFIRDCQLVIGRLLLCLVLAADSLISPAPFWVLGLCACWAFKDIFFRVFSIKLAHLKPLLLIWKLWLHEENYVHGMLKLSFCHFQNVLSFNLAKAHTHDQINVLLKFCSRLLSLHNNLFLFFFRCFLLSNLK